MSNTDDTSGTQDVPLYRFTLTIDCDTLAFKPQFYSKEDPNTYGDEWEQAVAVREQVARMLQNLAHHVYESEPGTGTPLLNESKSFKVKDTDGEIVGTYAWERI